MPVIARRTALQGAVSPSSDSSARLTGRRPVAKHRKPKTKTVTPRAAAAVMSVGLAVGGGTAVSALSTPQTASAATTTAASARGNQAIVTRPLLRYGDTGTAVRYVQASLDVPLTNWYGSATRSAVSVFQRQVRLPRTGTMTKRTWNSLYYLASRGRLHHHASTRGTTAFHAKVMREAAKLRGIPYVWGGTTTRGFDCSGYTGYVYKKAGKKLPRTSRQQYSATKHLSRASAKPGDLVFFKSGSGRVYHVGIYAGGNMLWQASRPGRPVAKSKIWSSSVAFGRA